MDISCHLCDMIDCEWCVFECFYMGICVSHRLWAIFIVCDLRCTQVFTNRPYWPNERTERKRGKKGIAPNDGNVRTAIIKFGCQNALAHTTSINFELCYIIYDYYYYRCVSVFPNLFNFVHLFIRSPDE